MQSSTWKAGLLLVLAALAGGAVGSALTVQAMHDRRGFGAGQRRGGDWYVDLLQRELKLSDGQRDSVRAILQRHRPDMDSIWGDFDTRLQQMRETIRAEVRIQLTPDQLTRYSGVTARLDAERRKMKKDSTDR
jgi:Spy/CpxP family protein refolding chaperone